MPLLQFSDAQEKPFLKRTGCFDDQSLSRPLPPPSILPVSSHGLDRGFFAKLATEFPALASLKPKKGVVYVHVNALGAFEKFGCMSEDTPVTMADGSHKPYWAVNIGDQVLSGSGNIRAVVNKFRRRVQEAIRLRIEGLPDDAVVSKNHPVEVVRPDQFVCERDACKRCLEPTFGLQNICKRGNGCSRKSAPVPMSERATADTLKAGDFLVYKFSKIQPPRTIGEAEGGVIGYWLSEGCFEYSSSGLSTLRFTFGLDEEDTEVKECQFLLSCMGLESTSYPQPEKSQCVVRVRTTDYVKNLAKEYKLWFGEHADGKRLPPWAVNVPKKTREQILLRYIRGDGSTCPWNRQTTARTASYDLAVGLQRLFWRSGIPAVACQIFNYGHYQLSYSHGGVPQDFTFGSDPSEQIQKVRLLLQGDAVYLPVREASTIAWNDWVLNMEVEEDHDYVAGGFYSHNCNSNGDAFYAEDCRKHHPTFVKHASFYYFHDHFPHSKKYGTVDASWWNDPMNRVELLLGVNEKAGSEALHELDTKGYIPLSMACLLGDTLVTTDEGLKDIRGIKRGDVVRTHNGRLRPVTAIMRRRVDSYLRIKLGSFATKEIGITGNHEIYVASFKRIMQEACASTSPSKATRRKYKPRLHETLEWTRADTVEEGEYLAVRIPNGDADLRPVQDDMASLLGYLVGAGSFHYANNGNGGADMLEFTQSLSDPGRSEIPELCDKLGYSATERPHGSCENAVMIYVCGSLAEEAMSWIGPDKHIPENLYCSPRSARMKFMATWYNADGFRSDHGMHWSVCRNDRAIQLQTLLASCGIPSSCDRIQHPDQRGYVSGGDGLEWVITVSKMHAYKFNGLACHEFEIPTKKIRDVDTFISGDYLMVPIRSIERVDAPVFVYNFSVEEDETYVAAGVVMHNCKIAHDVCSICKNKARNRSEYCYHAARELTKIADDGRLVCVFNPNPLWFDISRVKRPADKIAWSFRKVASETGVLSSAALAEIEGLKLPRRLRVGPDTINRLKKLASIEKRIEAVATGQCPDDEINALKLGVPSNNEIDLSGVTGADMDSIMKALGDSKIVLSLPEFFRLVLGSKANGMGDHFQEMQRTLPGVFNRMLHGEPDFDESPYMPQEGLVSSPECSIMKALEPDYSLEPRMVRKRIQLAVIKRPGEEPRLLGPSVDIKTASAARKMAGEYALYQLATSRYVNNDFVDLMMVLRNHVS